jgi:hypothetical protein
MLSSVPRRVAQEVSTRRVIFNFYNNNESLGKGFNADDGATLFMTFRALQSESLKQGEVHRAVAQELVSLVADPFGEWASNHAVSLCPLLSEHSLRHCRAQGTCYGEPERNS